MRRSSILPIVLLLLPGCTSLHVMSHVPLSTMSRLSAMKLADIDPVQLRVAARMPYHIEPRRDGVKVHLTMAGPGPAAGTTEQLILEAANEPQDLAGLSGHRRQGSRLWIFRLSEADVARLRRTIALSAGGSGERRISIAAGVDACRRAPLGSAALPTTTFLRTNASGFFILTEDLDLRGVVSERELVTKVPQCE